MRTDWEGTLPAPQQEVRISITSGRYGVWIKYAGTQDQLRAVIVTAGMEAKIASQTRGRKLDEQGRRFRLACSRAEWIAGFQERTAIYYEVGTLDAMALPGVRELVPDRFADGEQEAPTAQVRDRQVGRNRRKVVWTAFGNILAIDWTLIQGEVLVSGQTG